MSKHRTAAEKAIEVTKQRSDQYGHPRKVYASVSRLWSSYLDLARPITPKDVALMMVLFKMGREMSKTGEDNLVDMHGYLDVYERILREEGY